MKGAFPFGKFLARLRAGVFFRLCFDVFRGTSLCRDSMRCHYQYDRLLPTHSPPLATLRYRRVVPILSFRTSLFPIPKTVSPEKFVAELAD